MASNFCFMDICWLKDGSRKAPKHNFKWGETFTLWGTPVLKRANGRKLTYFCDYQGDISLKLLSRSLFLLSFQSTLRNFDRFGGAQVMKVGPVLDPRMSDNTNLGNNSWRSFLVITKASLSGQGRLLPIQRRYLRKIINTFTQELWVLSLQNTPVFSRSVSSGMDSFQGLFFLLWGLLLSRTILCGASVHSVFDTIFQLRDTISEPK